jgi:hypothetical protein
VHAIGNDTQSVRLAGGWFVPREKYRWLVADGWFVLREKSTAGWWLMSRANRAIISQAIILQANINT